VNIVHKPRAETQNSPTLFLFDNSYARELSGMHVAVAPTRVTAPRLIVFNTSLAEELGIEAAGASPDHLASIFSGNMLPAGAEPLAMAYAGHQFGHFVPQLGDGRAILLGEVIGRSGVRRDIQLKGAGPTPFSRRGDGRAALGPVLREYIVSEAMHALGIPATRALAAVLTGERVQRETGKPGAVFTRVAASHIRVGTFQFFAARGDFASVRRLADYTVARHYPQVEGSGQPFAALLAAVIDRQAALVAQWMCVGFIHGVMNTDNMAVSGETIDFGPCAFLDAHDPDKVFSSIDEFGRYRFANQSAAAHWNLARLAETLTPLLDPDEDRALVIANDLIAGFPALFDTYVLDGMRRKLGLLAAEEGDAFLVQDWLAMLHANQIDFTNGFRQLAGLIDTTKTSPLRDSFTDLAAFDTWTGRWLERLKRNNRPHSEAEAAMNEANPAIIPRNHQIERVIRAAEDEGDFMPFHTLLSALRRPYESLPEFKQYALPPAEGEAVRRTFCGT
jgi:serine/tyrosine/threonine adenylyltransferase